MLDAKISLVPMHQLIVPSTLLAPATQIRTHKVTKIHNIILKPLTYCMSYFFKIALKQISKTDHAIPLVTTVESILGVPVHVIGA